jgi:hypothetical protein
VNLIICIFNYSVPKYCLAPLSSTIAEVLAALEELATALSIADPVASQLQVDGPSAAALAAEAELCALIQPK